MWSENIKVMMSVKYEADPCNGDGCQLADWDSGFFGFPIARLSASHIGKVGMDAVVEWCIGRGIKCAYMLCDVGNQEGVAAAEAEGFRLVDVRLTLDAAVQPLPTEPSKHGTTCVRPTTGQDIDRLAAIARESHRNTRFYTDGNFDRQRCDDLYEFWLRRSCGGWAERVFVAEIDGIAAGYVTCHLSATSGRIGLFAIAAASRSRGAGTSLLCNARRWFAEHGAHTLSVVTQARNASALRLYQRTGMSVGSIQLW